MQDMTVFPRGTDAFEAKAALLDKTIDLGKLAATRAGYNRIGPDRGQFLSAFTTAMWGFSVMRAEPPFADGILAAVQHRATPEGLDLMRKIEAFKDAHHVR